MIIKTTKVVCGFPGIGKSYAYNKQKELGVFITDSDSSIFSKIPGPNGELIQNPEFPTNYIQHITELVQDLVIDYIFVSSHHDVRKGLADAHIPYTLIYPTKEMKEVYMQRYKDRGSPEKFIKFLDKEFDNFVDDCRKDITASARVIFDLPNDTLYDWVKFDVDEMNILKNKVNKTNS